MFLAVVVSVVVLALALYFIYWSDVVFYWSDPIQSHHRYKHYLVKKKQQEEEEELEAKAKERTEEPAADKNQASKDEAKDEALDTKDKFLVIGAGFSGLAVCGSLKRHHIAFDAVERNDQIGGNWYNGVYDTVHIISSKKTTEYKDWPMPESYPDFPSAKQMIKYMNDYCDFFRLRQHISFQSEVTNLVAQDDDGKTWKVTIRDLATGTERTLVYKGVVIANGHHWDRRMPKYMGQELFTGELIHSKDYKKPEQLVGKRVLVIGGGNSACDISVEGARFSQETHISLRRGYWFIPRSILGVPTVELIRPYIPLWLQKLLLEFLTFVVFGRYEKYGLQKPDHRLFEHHPTINSELLHYIRLGGIAPHSDIESFPGGKTVNFVDGTSIEVDMIVCCTGYYNSIPLLKSYVETIDNVPQLIFGMFVPEYRNIYFLGTGQPRYGAGPLLTSGSEFLGKVILAQDRLKNPISNVLRTMGGKPPTKNGRSADILVDPHVAYKQAVMASSLVSYLPVIEKYIIK